MGVKGGEKESAPAPRLAMAAAPKLARRRHRPTLL